MADIKPDEIYVGQCNFCKEEKKLVMFLNFQAICYPCAQEKFLPILIKFKAREVEDAGETA